MKVCTSCKIIQPLENFSFKNKSKATHVAICKNCVKVRDAKSWASGKLKEKNKSSKKLLEDRNKEFLWDLFLRSSCVDCGTSDPRILEFDHLRDKANNISRIFTSCSLVTLQEEINKCEIVCANCHRIRTHERANDWRYKKHGPLAEMD